MPFMWHSVQKLTEVPEGRDLRLAVIEHGIVHALVFPCRRTGNYFVDAKTNRVVELNPTHWQDWTAIELGGI